VRVQPYSSPLSERRASPIEPRPPIVPSDGVMPSPPETMPCEAGVRPVARGVVVPVRLVPVRARDVLLRDVVERDAVRRVPLAPVRRVLPVLLLLVVARAAVRPELLRRVADERAFVERVPVLRRVVPLLRLFVLRLFVLRPVLRAEARPPRVPSVFAAAFTRVDVLRVPVLRRAPVERVPVLRRVVPERLLVLRLRVPVERALVERP